MRRPPSTILWSITVLAGLAAFGASCGDPAGPEAEVNERRDAWEALGLDDYAYTLRVVCYCLDEVTNPVRVTVRGDTIASLTYVQSGAAVDSPYRSLFPDVDGLFDEIRDALDQGADSVDVRYHNTLHFPTHVWIDYDRRTADEEIGYEASDLTPLQGSQQSP